jgi:hypothetical protein
VGKSIMRASLLILSMLLTIGYCAQPAQCIAPVLTSSMSSGLGISAPRKSKSQKVLSPKPQAKRSPDTKQATPSNRKNQETVH